MKSVDRVQFTGTSLVAKCTDEKNVYREVHLADVRAGIVFPTGALPGYYVLFGRKSKVLPNGKRGLIFLKEAENINHDQLFSDLTDDCIKYRCRTIYGRFQRHDRNNMAGGFDDLWRYISTKQMGINLVPAPSSEDIEYGKAIAREYWMDEAMELPKMDVSPTVLVSQLKQLRGLNAEKRKDDQGPDEKLLYALHAFRYVLCGFVKFDNLVPYSRKPQRSSKANPKGWT